MSGVLATTAVMILAVQGDPQEPPDLGVRTGQTVWVTTTDGERTKGLVAGYSSQALDLSFDQNQRRYAVSDIRRIDVQFTDSVLDGTLTGLLAGAITGAVLGTILSLSSDCTGSFGPCFSGGEAIVRGTAVLGGIGAGVGLLADALRQSRRTVYQVGSGSAIEIRPHLPRRLDGIGVLVTWSLRPAGTRAGAQPTPARRR